MADPPIPRLHDSHHDFSQCESDNLSTQQCAQLLRAWQRSLHNNHCPHMLRSPARRKDRDFSSSTDNLSSPFVDEDIDEGLSSPPVSPRTKLSIRASTDLSKRLKDLYAEFKTPLQRERETKDEQKSGSPRPIMLHPHEGPAGTSNFIGATTSTVTYDNDYPYFL